MDSLNNNYIKVGDKLLYQRGANPNLRGMNTQFGNNFGINNKILDNNKETFKKYDIIPDKGLKSSIINKPHKFVVSFDNSHVGSSMILNEPFRDVVSVKLLNAIYMEAGPSDANNDGVESYAAPLFVTLSINELNNVYSTSTPAGGSLLDSFTTLDYDKTFDRDLNSTSGVGRVNIYKSKYQDIRYFDPPLNSLNQLNISIYDDETSTPSATFKCKLDFLVETKEKLRVY
jgi:hypothetical protein